MARKLRISENAPELDTSKMLSLTTFHSRPDHQQFLLPYNNANKLWTHHCLRKNSEDTIISQWCLTKWGESPLNTIWGEFNLYLKHSKIHSDSNDVLYNIVKLNFWKIFIYSFICMSMSILSSFQKRSHYK